MKSAAIVRLSTASATEKMHTAIRSCALYIQIRIPMRVHAQQVNDHATCTHQVRKYACDDLARLISIIILGTSSADLPRGKKSRDFSQMSSRSRDLPSSSFFCGEILRFQRAFWQTSKIAVFLHCAFMQLSSRGHPSRA